MRMTSGSPYPDPPRKFGAWLGAAAVFLLPWTTGCESAPNVDAPPPIANEGVDDTRGGLANASDSIRIFLVETASSDGPVPDTGFGCGDRLVPLSVPGKSGDLGAAIESLLTQPDTLGLDNVLFSEDRLVIDSVSLDPSRARIYLSGALVIGGVCDHPRIIEQLETTARVASGVDSLSVFLNGRSLTEYLSLRG